MYSEEGSFPSSATCMSRQEPVIGKCQERICRSSHPEREWPVLFFGLPVMDGCGIKLGTVFCCEVTPKVTLPGKCDQSHRLLREF